MAAARGNSGNQSYTTSVTQRHKSVLPAYMCGNFPAVFMYFGLTVYAVGIVGCALHFQPA